MRDHSIVANRNYDVAIQHLISHLHSASFCTRVRTRCSEPFESRIVCTVDDQGLPLRLNWLRDQGAEKLRDVWNLHQAIVSPILFVRSTLRSLNGDRARFRAAFSHVECQANTQTGSTYNKLLNSRPSVISVMVIITLSSRCRSFRASRGAVT